MILSDVNIPITVKFTRQYRVCDFLKSTRQLYKPWSDNFTPNNDKTDVGLELGWNMALEVSPIVPFFLSRKSKLQKTLKCDAAFWQRCLTYIVVFRTRPCTITLGWQSHQNREELYYKEDLSACLILPKHHVLRKSCFLINEHQLI